MRMSNHHKFIFFANPKTGSDTVRRMLDPFSDFKGVPYRQRTPDNPFYSHIRPVEVKEILSAWGWDFNEYYRFTFIRNPWARLVSLYEMIKSNDSRAIKQRFASALRPMAQGKVRRALNNLCDRNEPPPFKKWLRSILPYGTGAGGPDYQRWRRYGTYTIQNYVGDERGRRLVDKIIKLEEINEQLPATLRQIGLPVDTIDVPHVNVRKHKHYHTYYDDDSRLLVQSMYADEIEEFNYRF